MCVYHIFFTHPFAAHLGCFQVLAIVNDAVVNMRVQVSLRDSDSIVFVFEYLPRSGIARSYYSSISRTIPIYIPTNITQAFPFIHSLANTFFRSFTVSGFKFTDFVSPTRFLVSL